MSDESIIKVLEPALANKIAAGEVVQRPASVIKELMDNAIDSGADEITIEVLNAGRTLIRVVDNGCGMSKDDLRLCFTRHATSKISSIDDLFNIRTMGFRGEAMASIAAVSQVMAQTKRVEDENGWKYEIWGSEERTLEPDAVQNGTSISVSNLFYNVPARRQFLKTDATEFRHLLRVIQQMALANTNIHFRFIADGDQIFDLPIQDIKSRVASLFGDHYKPNLIELAEETSYLTVSGVISDPAFTKRTRGEQFLFVNGRPFQDRVISYNIMKEYEHWKKPEEYPFYALFLEIDPSKVDVNVHPSKMEVKFDDERSVLRLLTSVVKRAINEFKQVPILDNPFAKRPEDDYKPNVHFSFNTGEDLRENDTVKPSTSFNLSGAGSGGGSSSSNYSKFTSQKPTIDGHQAASTLYGKAQTTELNTPNQTTITFSPTDKLFDKAGPQEERRTETDKGFWQLHNTYVVTQTRSGLTLIDQSAAHRRIIYEHTLSSMQFALPSTQQLLFAQTMEFSLGDFNLLKELMPMLRIIGYNIQILSGQSCVVYGVPADIEMGDEKEVISGILEQYQKLGSLDHIQPNQRMAMAVANKTAIGRGKKMSSAEMENLVDKLFECEEPFTDPLGKPTLIYISMEEIAKRFRS